MNDEFDKRMCRTFPALFLNREKSEQESWGFEVPKSWYLLLFDLCTKLRAVSVAFEIPITVDQVKQSKFGTLRFYYTVPKDFKNSTADSIIADLITLAEQNSHLN